MMEAATGSTEKYWGRRKETGRGELALLCTKGCGGVLQFNPDQQLSTVFVPPPAEQGENWKGKNSVKTHGLG